MGDYASPSDVTVIFKAGAALDWVVVGDDILNPYIDAHEAEINAALEAMDYPTIPVTATADIALLKREIARVTAGDIYQEQYPFEKVVANLQNPTDEQAKLHMTKADNLLKLARQWQQDYRTWLHQLANGDIRLAGSTPDARERGAMSAGYIEYSYIQTSDDS